MVRRRPSFWLTSSSSSSSSHVVVVLKLLVLSSYFVWMTMMVWSGAQHLPSRIGAAAAAAFVLPSSPHHHHHHQQSQQQQAQPPVGWCLSPFCFSTRPHYFSTRRRRSPFVFQSSSQSSDTDRTSSPATSDSGASSSSSSSTGAVVAPPPPPPVYYYNTVRRVYETYPWTYQGQTYNINYRVVDGPAVSVKNNNNNGGVATTNILLIHGFGANVNHFRYNIPVLASAPTASYRVYAIDLLGFGASDKPNNVQYCMELFFALCTDFINDMNRKQEQQQQQQQSQPQQQQQQRRQPSPCWFVAGNSIGGLTALGVARALPQTIQGVILFACADGMSFFRYTPDTFPVYTWPLVWFFQHVVLSPMIGGAFFQNFKTRENVERVLRGQVYVNTTHVDDELLEILLAPGDDVGAQDVFLKVMAGEPGPRPGDILPLVTCPILALWGERDPWTTIYGPAGAPFRALAASTSSCAADGDSTSSTSSRRVELVIIPNAGHCVMDEVPDIVHGRMIPWMDAVRQRYDPRQQLQQQQQQQVQTV